MDNTTLLGRIFDGDSVNNSKIYNSIEGIMKIMYIVIRFHYRKIYVGILSYSMQ